jgi:chromosome segregation ATPase
LPAKCSESNKHVVNKCREFIDFEPSFLPNVKAITMGEVYAKVREHNAKLKELKQAHKVVPNPGRSDPNNRFHGGKKQVSAPLAELADEIDELEAEMARHERGLIGTGDVSAPIAEATPAADAANDDAETAADMLADMQSKLEEQMEKVRALEAAEAQRFARLPPDTRPNMFQTPAEPAWPAWPPARQRGQILPPST